MLDKLCIVLGWQGGTREQVLQEVRRLVQFEHDVTSSQISDLVQENASLREQRDGLIVARNELAKMLEKWEVGKRCQESRGYDDCGDCEDGEECLLVALFCAVDEEAIEGNYE